MDVLPLGESETKDGVDIDLNLLGKDLEKDVIQGDP